MVCSSVKGSRNEREIESAAGEREEVSIAQLKVNLHGSFVRIILSQGDSREA